MIDLSDITIEQIENDGKKGIFKIGPLPKGYGHTLANPLRRVILSSVHGTAVTSMRLAGAEHEYSTISGIKETVIGIQMNIKALQLRCDSDEPQVIRLKKSGKGAVTAADLELTESVTVVDPKGVIATLTDSKASIDMELVVEKGIGFRPADEGLRSEVGRLPMNADFSPVERAMFDIEQTRKGEQMDLDLIVMTIFTDGSVDPGEALGRSAEILGVAFNKMVTLLGLEPEAPVETVVADDTGKGTAPEAAEWLVEDVSLSNRTKSRLMESGLEKVGELAEKTAEDLLEIPGFGEAALSEVKDMLNEYGLSLKE